MDSKIRIFFLSIFLLKNVKNENKFLKNLKSVKKDEKHFEQDWQQYKFIFERRAILNFFI